jgi:hypothetical protein
MSTTTKPPLNTPESEGATPEILVPDPVVWREFGITSMTGYRWSHDPDLNFPPAVKIKERNFRSRRQLEEFKTRLMHKALAGRAGRGA